MNSIKHKFTLDMRSSQSQVCIPARLGDTNRSLHINLSEGGSPYFIETGSLAKLTIKRPTGTRIVEFCNIKNNSTVVYRFSQNENTCAVEGIHECDLVLYGPNGGVIASPRFSMVVSERVIRSDDIDLKDDDRTAIDAMVGAEASRREAENSRANAEAARVSAEENRASAEAARADASSKKISEMKTKIAEVDKKVKDGDFDGFSPIVITSAVDGGTEVRITDAKDTKVFVVLNGTDGDKGDAFTYEDFTPEQLASLKGDAFTYEDFTPEQLAALKGADGTMTFEDLTEEQKASLKGDPFTYEDFTPEQLASLKGDAFTYEDFTPEQLASLKGADGTMTFEDLTEEQKASLKGDKGDPYTLTDTDKDSIASKVKSGMTASDIGAADSSHKHTKSEITDFPTSMTPTSHTHKKEEITDFPTSMTPTAHNQGADTITAGTFAGQVVANSGGQSAGTSLLRNCKLVSAEENPTVEGEIVWIYK